VGVTVFGSPATERDKRFVAERVGAAVHATGADGAILATEGFGNNHVDFALTLKEITAYGMPCVGVTWAARQGRLVAGNEYMVALVEVNRSPEGRESRIVAENTARPQDARRAIAMVKSLITGIDILPAPAEWDAPVVAENDRLVEEEAAFVGGTPSATAGLRSEVPVPLMQPGQLALLAIPLAQARVALVTASGAYLQGQEPFDLAGDHSHRLVPATTPGDRVLFASGGYDHTDVNRDPNVMLPLEPLQELIAAGRVGSATSAHIGFQGGGGDLDLVREKLGPAVLSRLREMHADAVLFTAG
jgi:D-proline reductase (dithiol) PrdA